MQHQYYALVYLPKLKYLKCQNLVDQLVHRIGTQANIPPHPLANHRQTEIKPNKTDFH